jgi:nicotinamide-nucleotide amidase
VCQKARTVIERLQVENFSIPGDSEFQELVQALAARLIGKGWKLATAESCTGGWIAKCCTDLAGSSGWFEGGFVTYSNEAKAELLGVEPAILQSDGAVSEAVARQMAEGARRRSAVDIAVAVTGVAGPDGGTEDKPVGMVWFGWMVKGGEPEAEVVQFPGDRDAIRRQTVVHALRGLLDRT